MRFSPRNEKKIPIGPRLPPPAIDREHDVAIFCVARGLTADEADIIWEMYQSNREATSGGAFIREMDGLIAELRRVK